MPPIEQQEQQGGTEEKDLTAAAGTGGDVTPKDGDAKDGGDSGNGTSAASEKTADDGKEKRPASALDAVKAALKKSTDLQEKQANAAKDGKPPAPGAEDDGKDKDKDKDAAASANNNGKPQAAGHGGDANSRIRQLNAENKALQPRAAMWDELSTWVRGNGLSKESVQQSLEIARLIRQDPRAALRMVDSIRSELRLQLGDDLPDDLRQRVDAGEITEAAAKEIHEGRAARTTAERQQAERRQHEERQEQEAAVRSHAMAVGTAVSNWEKQWQVSDPDYSKKINHVRREISRLFTEEGVPETPELNVELCKRARETIESELKELMPKSTGIKTPQAGGGRRDAGGTPRTAVEAAKMALEGRHPTYAAQA